MLNNLKKILLEKIIQSPKTVLWTVLCLFLIAASGVLKLETDFSYRAWYEESDEVLKIYDEYEKNFGNDDSLIIGIYNQKGLLDSKGLQLLSILTEKVSNLDLIVRADSLINYDYIQSKDDDITIAPLLSRENIENFSKAEKSLLRQRIQETKLLNNYLISQDEKLALIRTKPKTATKKREGNQEVIEQIENILKSHGDKDYKIFLTGGGTFIDILRELAIRDFLLIAPIVSLIFSFIFYYLFRNLLAVFLALLTITLSITFMAGLSGFLGQYITTISSAAPVILLTVATADAIHLLTVYFLSLRQGHSHLQAARYSFNKNFYPTLLTSFTTAIGFLSISYSEIKSLGHMGIQIGIGVIGAWIFSYGVLAPLLIILGKKKEKKEDKAPSSNVKLRPSSRAISFTQTLIKHRFIIASSTIILTLLSIIGVSKLEINLDPHGQFKNSHPFKQSISYLKEHLGYKSQIEIMVKAPKENGGVKNPVFLNSTEKFEKWINQQKDIVSTISIIDIIKDVKRTLLALPPQSYVELPSNLEEVGQILFFYNMGVPPGRDINNMLNPTGNVLRIIVNWNIYKSSDVLKKVDIISSKAKEFNLNATVTGKTPLFHKVTPYVVSSFLNSFALTLLTITILLIFILKSFRLGVLALIPNVLPLIFSGGIFALSGEYLDISSVLIASACLGIAVDDSIHFLFEFKKLQQQNLKLQDIFAHIFTTTGPSLINTTLVIALGFGSFALADYIPNAKFGVMVSITLLLALIADLIILPIALYYAYRKK